MRPHPGPRTHPAPPMYPSAGGPKPADQSNLATKLIHALRPRAAEPEEPFGSATIGRANDNDIVVPDVLALASRLAAHAARVRVRHGDAGCSWSTPSSFGGRSVSSADENPARGQLPVGPDPIAPLLSGPFRPTSRAGRRTAVPGIDGEHRYVHGQCQRVAHLGNRIPWRAVELVDGDQERQVAVLEEVNRGEAVLQAPTRLIAPIAPRTRSSHMNQNRRWPGVPNR